MSRVKLTCEAAAASMGRMPISTGWFFGSAASAAEPMKNSKASSPQIQRGFATSFVLLRRIGMGFELEHRSRALTRFGRSDPPLVEQQNDCTTHQFQAGTEERATLDETSNSQRSATSCARGERTCN